MDGIENFDISCCELFDFDCQRLISGTETEHEATCAFNFEISLDFPQFKPKSFGNLWGNSYAKL